MSDNPQDQIFVLAALGLIGAIILLADVIIFVRWLHHRYKVYDMEQQYHDYLGQYVPESGWQDPAEWLAAARARLRPPFAATWSVVDPFVGFQVVFGISQVVITVALMPLIMRNLSGAQEVIFSPSGILIQAVGLIFMNALFAATVIFYVSRYDVRQQAILEATRDQHESSTGSYDLPISFSDSGVPYSNLDGRFGTKPQTFWRRCASSLKSIGLGKPSVRLIALGLGLGLALFAVANATEYGLSTILPHLLPKPVMDTLERLTKETTAGGLFTKIHSVPIKILFALAGAIAAPIGEELFFRGFLYNALKRRFNVSAGIVISGLVFALVHFGPLAVLVIFPMGMILAYVYERTRSLWVTMTMHAVNNGLSFILAFMFPHLGESPAQKAKPTTPPSGRPAIHRSISDEDVPLNRKIHTKRLPQTGERK